MSNISILASNNSVAIESADRKAMEGDLKLIADVREGLPAMKARASVYLPQYKQESQDEYKRRVATAPWRPEFADALHSLAAKPFTKPVTLGDGASDAVKSLAEDIDGRGNNLHSFAREVMIEAIANGVHGIMVSYPFGEFRTMADEKEVNPRPYWHQVSINEVIACYTEFLNGREIVTHLRLRGCALVRDGFTEKYVDEVRVYEPGRWELWRQQGDNGGFELHSSGEIRTNGGLTKEVFVTFLFTGKRSGTLKTKPPLRDLADVQVELYRALSRQDEILTYAGSPMLGTSLGKPADDPRGGQIEIPVGPKTILFGGGTVEGASGSVPWGYVQPDAANIKEVRDQVQSVIEDARYLGMQPVVARSGDVSATAAAVNAAKAHSVLESWALNLKDRLEQAFVFTSQWMRDPKPTKVNVHTDFGVGLQGNEEAKTLLEGQKNQVISKKTVRSEWQRRGILGDAFDPDNEDEQIALEQQGFEPDEAIDPVSGSVIPFNEHAA